MEAPSLLDVDKILEAEQHMSHQIQAVLQKKAESLQLDQLNFAKEEESFQVQYQELQNRRGTQQARLDKQKNDRMKRSLEVSGLKSELHHLREKLNMMRPTLVSIDHQRNLEEEKIVKLKGDVMTRKEQESFQQSELQKAILFYKRLGLSIDIITKPEKLLRVTFTQINIRFPNQEYSFLLKLDPSEQYSVLRCSPDVGNVSTMIHTLNQTDDFSGFIRSMRKAFQATTSV